MKYLDFFPTLIKKSEEEECSPELKKGIETEKEHTNDIELAKKIATDHLKEDPKYYSKLGKCGIVGHLYSLMPDKSANISGKIENTPKNLKISSLSQDATVGLRNPHVTGDIQDTPNMQEGGSKILEPNAGITSDMTRDGKPARWTINAYPTK